LPQIRPALPELGAVNAASVSAPDPLDMATAVERLGSHRSPDRAAARGLQRSFRGAGRSSK
jgi:hypothetical protein